MIADPKDEEGTVIEIVPGDYRLIGGDSLWIEIKQGLVHIYQGDKGLSVSIYANVVDPTVSSIVTETYASWDELSAILEEEEETRAQLAEPGCPYSATGYDTCPHAGEGCTQHSCPIQMEVATCS